jgi:hypothetical protein
MTDKAVRCDQNGTVQLRAACRKRGKGRRCGRRGRGNRSRRRRRLTWGARYPPHATAIAQFLRLRDRLILKVRMSSPECPRDVIDLVAATVNAFVGIIEHTILVPELVEAARRRVGSLSPKTSERLRISKVDMLCDTDCLLSASSAACSDVLKPYSLQENTVAFMEQ